MNRTLTSSLSLQLAIAVGLSAQPPAGQIDDALTRGTKSKACDVASKGKAFGEATGFDVLILGPLNRIECAAAAAAKKYKTLSVEEATSLGIDSRLEIIADPVTPIRWSNGSLHITPPATHVVLLPGRGQDSDGAVQPDSIFAVPAEWGNAAGGKFQSRGIRAWFGASKVPEGEFTLVIITADKEFRYRVSGKDRQLIR